MNASFKIGDTVKVKGSSVIITIYNIINPDGIGKVSYLCKWIDDSKQPHEQLYRQEQLQLA